MSGREDRDPPEDRDGGRESDRHDGGESSLAVAAIYPGAGRSGGRATRSLTRDDTRLLDDVARVLPSTTTERGTITFSRSTQAWKLLSRGRLVVNFGDNPSCDHSRLFLLPISAKTWIVLTPDGDKHAQKFSEHSKMRMPPIGEGETPEIGSVEFSRGWTLDGLSELVREGRNLFLSARTSMGLTYDRDPAMMCDLSGRLFSVPLSEGVKRRMVRKLPCGDLLLPIHLRCHAHLREEHDVNEYPAYDRIMRFLCPIMFG